MKKSTKVQHLELKLHRVRALSSIDLGVIGGGKAMLGCSFTTRDPTTHSVLNCTTVTCPA